MSEKRSSLLLSLLLGGLIGGGISFLLTSSLMRKRSGTPAREAVKWESEGTQERSYEGGVYCAPEGADMHYDVGDDIYYSNEQ